MRLHSVQRLALRETCFLHHSSVGSLYRPAEKNWRTVIVLYVRCWLAVDTTSWSKRSTSASQLIVTFPPSSMPRGARNWRSNI